jgi:hypothetical protein
MLETVDSVRFVVCGTIGDFRVSEVSFYQRVTSKTSSSSSSSSDFDVL